MIHWEGDPNGCAEKCTGPHFDDAAPETCSKCGGPGRTCFALGYCVESRQGAYEPWEGRTGAQEARDDDYGPGVVGAVAARFF